MCLCWHATSLPQSAPDRDSIYQLHARVRTAKIDRQSIVNDYRKVFGMARTVLSTTPANPA